MENEKDRSGKNNEFAERGAEDFYFAARDRELLEELKDAVSAAREQRAQICPKCAGNFERYKFMELVLDRCRECKGTWLNNGQLDLIVKKAARGPLGVFLDRCFSKDQSGGHDSIQSDIKRRG